MRPHFINRKKNPPSVLEWRAERAERATHEDVVDLGLPVVGVEGEHGGGELGVLARHIVRVHVLAPQTAAVAVAQTVYVHVRHRLQAPDQLC